MSPTASLEPPLARLGVPLLFNEGRFEQVLILTFGADLEFYERVLRRHFGSYRNQIVLADAAQLGGSISAMAVAGGLRHLNRSWIAGPIRSRHAAHAKAILLAGPDAGLLLVGSGNLNISGYAGAGECFTPYRWSSDLPEDLEAFTAVRSLVDGLAAGGFLDAVTCERLSVFWSAYDWWHAPSSGAGPVRHNLVVPLGEQFVAELAGERVEELTVAAPFHDQKCAALQRLAQELKPKKLRVLAQPGHCSVDPVRLSSVLASHRGEAYALTASGDLDTTYLHAKLVIARTKTRSVALTGSANSSIVALWGRQPVANIELANLTVGSPRAFDYLFDPNTVTITGPVDPATLEVSFQGDDGKSESPPPIALDDLRWTAPSLTCTIIGTQVDPAAVRIEILGREIQVLVQSKKRGSDSEVTIELLDAEDVEVVERVAVVTIWIDDIPLTGVAYQLARLREQDRRRVDPDRLRHAARLELDDPDLEHALAALEQILIGENVARWSHGSPEKDSGLDSDADSVAWDDIDWEAVRRHPLFTAYGGLGGLGVPGSDLAAYLDALSQAVREMVEPEPSARAAAGGRRESEAGDDDDDPAGDVSAGLEGADVDGLDDGEEDEAEGRRHQSIAARNLRLVRNFVRRNLNALEQPAFRAGAGPGIVIPNIIVLNWVCWWVATKDEDRPGELIDERLRLWRLIWGDLDDSAAYLDELDDEMRGLVLDRFDEQHVESVTIASMVDAWTYMPDEASAQYRLLRSILRHAVNHPCWQVSAQHAAEAARLTNGRPTTEELTDPLGIAETLWSAACEVVDDYDTRAVVARALGTERVNVLMSDEPVIVDGANDQRHVRQAEVFTPDASDEELLEAFALWQGIDARAFYRLKWPGGVALYRADDVEGFIYRSHEDEIKDITEIEPMYPPWRVALDVLCDSVETLSEEAA